MVVYTVQMRRKPLFYIFNMVLPCNLITLPCNLITFVALLGFYVPSDSGEKITMGITTLLSMTVFLMIVADSMPATSDVLPLIGRSNFHFCSHIHNLVFKFSNSNLTMTGRMP
jgi:hypothetical protein